MLLNCFLLVLHCSLSQDCISLSICPAQVDLGNMSSASSLTKSKTSTDCVLLCPPKPSYKWADHSCVDLSSYTCNEQLIDLSRPQTPILSNTVKAKPMLGTIRKNNSCRNSSSLEMKSVESIESSDTFASCFTHPFNSQADLSEPCQDQPFFGIVSASLTPMSITFEMCPLSSVITTANSLDCHNEADAFLSDSNENSKHNSKVVSLVLPVSNYQPEPNERSFSSPAHKISSLLHSIRSRIGDEHCDNREHNAKSTLPKWITLKSRSMRLSFSVTHHLLLLYSIQADIENTNRRRVCLQIVNCQQNKKSLFSKKPTNFRRVPT